MDHAELTERKIAGLMRTIEKLRWQTELRQIMGRQLP